jgi:uracil-DNA glycosylase
VKRRPFFILGIRQPNLIPLLMSSLFDRIDTWLHQHREIYGSFNPDQWDNYTQSSVIVPKSTEIPTSKIETSLNSLTSLEELKLWCLENVELRTDLPNTNLVFGVGNPTADLMLIGEAPGEQEDLHQEPFVGKAGQLLNKILEAINFSREDVYIANILKHRPPNNRDPLPEERDRSLPVLMRQIELVQPKIILCLGKISAQTLLNSTASMKDLRGIFHPWNGGIELAVTYHPAALLRNPEWKKDTWDDVRMVRKRYNDIGAKP